MDPKDLLKNPSDLTGDLFDQRLYRLTASSPRFGNLDKKNRKTIVDIFRKYNTRLRRGEGLSDYIVQSEMANLRRKMQELDLSEEDLADIKEILKLMKSR